MAVVHPGANADVLSLGQVPRLGRGGQAGEQPKAKEGDGQGDDSVNDEELQMECESASVREQEARWVTHPLPPGHSANAVQVLVRSRLQVPAEHGSQRVAAEPESCSLE